MGLCRKTSCYFWCFLKCTKIQVDQIVLYNSWGNTMLWFHSQVFKWKDLILHVITSLSVSRTYLPINLPVWETLIWEMECDPRQFPEPCVCSGMSLVCLCVLAREHMPWLSCRPSEAGAGTAQSSLSLPKVRMQSPCGSPDLSHHSTDTLLFWQPGSSSPRWKLWSPLFVSRAVTGEILQISQGRWIIESNMTGGQRQRGGQGMCSYLSLQDVSGTVLGASVWLLPVTLLQEA